MTQTQALPSNIAAHSRRFGRAVLAAVVLLIAIAVTVVTLIITRDDGAPAAPSPEVPAAEVPPCPLHGTC